MEQNLTDYYGTSRAPVREALFILENQGIVERRPRKGVFVKKYTFDEIVEFYDVVYELTRFAIKKGIESDSNESTINELEKLISSAEELIEVSEFKTSFELIEQIHKKIFEVSHNIILIDIYEKLNKRWTTFRYITLSHSSSLKKSIKEYRDIYNVLINKDLNKIDNVLAGKKDRALTLLKRYS